MNRNVEGMCDIMRTVTSGLIVVLALHVHAGTGAASVHALTEQAPGYPGPGLSDEGVTLYQRAATCILKHAKVPSKGYCLVYGGGTGRLARALAECCDIIGWQPSVRFVLGRLAAVDFGPEVHKGLGLDFVVR